jgi:uncharacterized protein with ParB-like and HNH nuclease domain
MNEPITFYHYFNNTSTVIPITQRDYAQGRNGRKEKQVLRRFLLDLRDSITQKRKISLNFIYGIERSNNEFMPIDGQQRLTTLFLFHWFVALKCGKLEDFLGTSKNFTYQTRSSAMDFFATLQCKDKISDFFV